MKIGLFIPCYIDQFYPKVAVSVLQVLEGLGLDVTYPLEQTCCGQPMANAGFSHLTAKNDELFIRNFSGFDYIVSPSGSCVLHLKDHLHSEQNNDAALEIRSKIMEFSEFLTDIIHLDKIDAVFNHRVALHQGCHGQRGLHLSQMSELVAPPFSKTTSLLKKVRGLELVELTRPDECCGFGGTFCVSEEAVSVKMGKDRLRDYLQHDAEVITGSDMSCLMHLEGILRRQKNPVKVMHIAEILNAR
jgi:L-lactate dehydrogenase complex protein LldE